ncbi:hypothetical protein [Corynebacterium sp.]|uniref:hypothetical protein n=1 Tax=Corynebacterium sp. TaxID=1720 RepID=UPI0026DC3E49|nr:hypothetical protein [Corynebacterium sp.]MDO5076982.1 hypothetical protein [Corynebacterium sp.]
MHAQRRRLRTASTLATSLVALATLTLAGCSAESDPAEDNVPVLSTMKKTQSASSTSNAASSGTYIDQTLNDGGPAWNFPLVFDGWTMAPRNEQNKLQLEHTNGCSYTATQQPFTSEGKSDDRAESQRQADDWKTALASESTDPVFTVEESTDIRGIGDTKVSTLRADATYTSADGQPKRSSAWFRTFASASKPMAMTLEYACPAEAYNETELNDLLENTRLMNVEHTTLD